MDYINYTTAIFLINQHARAIKTEYEKDGPTTIHKTLDPSIKVDDLLVVQTGTRHGFTVVKAVEVDVDIDLESTTPMKWIVKKLDIEEFEKLDAMEADAIEKIKSARLREKRNKLRDALLNDTEELKGLAISDMSEATEAALEAPSKSE